VSALRALASTPRDWHISCTSSSLAGVRAIAMAGIAVTPCPLHAMMPDYEPLAEEQAPKPPEVISFSRLSGRDTESVVAFAGYCERVLSEGGSRKAREPSADQARVRGQAEECESVAGRENSKRSRNVRCWHRQNKDRNGSHGQSGASVRQQKTESGLAQPWATLADSARSYPMVMSTSCRRGRQPPRS